MIDDSQIIEIDEIGNYYGCLNVLSYNNKFYWLIEDWNTDKQDINSWIEIPRDLFLKLVSRNSNSSSVLKGPHEVKKE